jgi:MFS family permease
VVRLLHLLDGRAVGVQHPVLSTLSPASGTLAGSAALGVGILARPVGGVLWGHFGDRVGRKAMLVASLVLMGGATVGVGLLPTYEQIGVLAPILLVLLRLLQGVSAGGEWGGAAVMAVEHAPPGKRGAYGSFSQVGVPAGLILAQLMFIAVSAWTTPEQFTPWGLAAALPVQHRPGRRRPRRAAVPGREPVFSTLLREQARSRRPIVEVFRERRREVVLAALSFVANTTIGYIFRAYLLAYGTAVLELSRGFMLTVVIIGSVFWLVPTSWEHGGRTAWVAGRSTSSGPSCSACGPSRSSSSSTRRSPR